MRKIYFLILATMFLVTGCRTVHDANRVSSATLANEGTIVFVRPDDHTLLGTRSISDYVEISYETSERNIADLLVVKAGIRNRGGSHFWDTVGPQYQLKIKTVFYQIPISTSSAPVYETNWETITMQRGDTQHYQIICPNKKARYYQISISELNHGDI